MKTGRARISHRDGIGNVKFAPSTVVKQTECCVAALLNLRDHKTSADRVDRPGRDEHGVAHTHRMPYDQI